MFFWGFHSALYNMAHGKPSLITGESLSQSTKISPVHEKITSYISKTGWEIYIYIFMEEFEVKALSSISTPFPLAKVCWWHLCYQQGRTQSGPTSTHQQLGPTHTVHSGTNTTMLTTIPGHPCHHRTRQHLQHHSLQEAHPHRPISTLGQ